MLLSLSNEQTTLYDQIEYAGNPSSFAWVLPIKGIADVGLSSDLLFNVLDKMSDVAVQSPVISCPTLRSCSRSDFESATTATTSRTSATTTGGEDPVQVLAQETVGPFETVQLASTDPSALTDWLSGHGYNVPPDIQPLVDAYVNEGFNFLAMKLVPGVGVAAMRPVRITTAGASPALPLRMVAAGTGNTTVVTLWIVAEGRYQPANFPWFTIDQSELVWDWNTRSSNYTSLRQQRYDESGGLAWQVESALSISEAQITGPVLDGAEFDPETSGYDAMNATTEAEADLSVLLDSLATGSLWLTRLRAELSRAAFTKDLTIEAADAQSVIPTLLLVTKTKGELPCPPQPVCDDDGEGCATSSTPNTTFGWIALPLAVMFVLARSRRRRR